MKAQIVAVGVAAVLVVALVLNWYCDFKISRATAAVGMGQLFFVVTDAVTGERITDYSVDVALPGLAEDPFPRNRQLVRGGSHDTFLFLSDKTEQAVFVADGYQKLERDISPERYLLAAPSRLSEARIEKIKLIPDGEKGGNIAGE